MNFMSKLTLSLFSFCLLTVSLMAAPDAEVMKRGEAVYNRTCIACHQANGQGIDPVFPPLAGSEWVTKNPSVIVRNILHGLAGPITVKGKAYNGMMPAVAGVSDAEIADVVTFVRNSWGNTAAVVSEEEVKAIKAKYADRKTPWTAEELDKDLK